jgi:phosphocarrier protein HPr
MRATPDEIRGERSMVEGASLHQRRAWGRPPPPCFATLRRVPLPRLAAGEESRGWQQMSMNESEAERVSASSADVSTAAVRAEASIVITHAIGLHARPAVKLTQLASSFASDVALRVDEGSEWINAKSIVKVMKLKARAQSTLHFRAEGRDAEEAVRRLVDLVQRDFDESTG